MNYIKVRLSGGLGNQLFQAAFGVAKSISWNAEVIFDARSYKNYKTHGLELTKFPRIYDNYQFLLNEKTLFEKLNEKVGFNNNIFNEKKLGYQEINSADCLGKELVGYWQTERYFVSVKEYIHSLFQPDAATSLLVDGLFSKLNLASLTDAVCLHIRRGDYANDRKANAVHGLLPIDYYLRAMESHKNKQVYVFSDDIDWCEANVPSNWEVLKNQGENPVETLIFMSQFSNFIIGNSTFSWWGAYLSSSKKKKITCPKNWFIGSGYSNPDLIPLDWQIME